jgi:hypothetical protein
MEAPYANYSRSFINNLNDRQDIVGRPALKTVLQVGGDGMRQGVVATY